MENYVFHLPGINFSCITFLTDYTFSRSISDNRFVLMTNFTVLLFVFLSKNTQMFCAKRIKCSCLLQLIAWL